MSSACYWVLGRGASIANGLHWTVPREWYDDLDSGQVSRNELIARIKQALNHEMDKPAVDGGAYRRLVAELSQRTSDDWYHRFLTTNWDTLLERELFPVIRAEDVVPRWLGNQSHVFHLNGTIEEEATEHRSPFLLETDAASERVGTHEANKAYNQFLWSKCAVVVGMSFACETDRTFLAALNRDEDNMPIGEASVYVVNPDRRALDDVCNRITGALPASEITPIEKGFDDFIEGGLSELIGGALTR